MTATENKSTLTKYEKVQLKAKLFAQYLGQKVLSHDEYADSSKQLLDWTRFSETYMEGEHYLLLKPLSSISEEDALFVVKLEYIHAVALRIDSKEESGISFSFRRTYSRRSESMSFEALTLQQGDYLRSKGYAVQYMNHSVEELVKMGIYKLVD